VKPWRLVLFITGSVVMLSGILLSSLWVGILGIGIMIPLLWKPSEGTSPTPHTPDTHALQAIHAALGDLLARLFAPSPTEEQQNLLTSWQNLSPQDTPAMLSLLSQVPRLLPDISFDTESLSLLQKAFYKLPYLRILLLNVIEKTEEATNTLIENFISVSEKNRQTLEEVQKRIELHEGDSLDHLMSQSSQITESYQHIKDEYESLTAQNKQQIDEFSRQLSTMFAQLQSINEILAQNKIIAVNLSIEGVKFGDKGKAIKVIVQEIQKLNQKIDQFTSEVSHQLEQFETFTQELWNNWREHMEKAVTQFQKASDNASLLIEKLRDASQHMNDIASLLEQNARAMQGDLDGIIESLQFQDITRQQIENVMSYLGQIQDDIKKGSSTLARFGITLDKWDIEKMNEAKDEMVREAKVSSERFLLK